MVPLLETFDYNNATSPISERPVTTVAPQALMLLNDAFVQDQAAAPPAAWWGTPGCTGGRSTPTALVTRHRTSPVEGGTRRLQDSRHRQTALWSSLADRITFVRMFPIP